ncbi:nuclear transport factor 2 family protein [Lentzea sp. PSKA42]|uniref:Nuclear transport factor 2 family protein n=1 Tax=Lentzea indica TaxID=2604800 RepID=A0ABX1FQ53_9PSEU|nr:nuclear transport factor 2 family protein [Lentzea indica]NKE60875.1 nuclear transport factor 2 family protein [Lentzea indica]
MDDFARKWAHWWNTRDLEGLLEHYSDDVLVRSPAAARLLGDGILRGKQAVREFWEAGLKAVPDVRFEVLDVFTGVDTVILSHRNQNGLRGAEVFTFRAGQVVEVVGAMAV